VPRRAGSPALGATLKTLSVSVSVTGRRPSGRAVTLFVTVPTTLLPGQASASKSAWLHLAAAFGLPTSPAGRWRASDLRLSLTPLKTVSMVTFGCPAACVLAGVTLNDEIPRSARAGLAQASRADA